jgi:NAD(P)-dependent dehydrogenase (short-subunit alcohol dehydrogenase family)
VVTAPSTIITGAAAGIGRATALRLAGRGDRTALLDIDQVGLDQTTELIRAAGGTAEPFCIDVRSRSAVDAVCARVKRSFGSIDYVFSNAGVTLRKPVASLTLDEWRFVIDTHVGGAFNLCQASLPALLERGAGAIVVTSSDYAVAGMRGSANYAAAKAALYSLAKSLALEFGPRGIRVNAVGPGPIDTPQLQRGRTREQWEALIADRQARLPMQRLGRPEEVASIVDFLLSDRSAYITGQLLQPNGGQLMW